MIFTDFAERTECVSEPPFPDKDLNSLLLQAMKASVAIRDVQRLVEAGQQAHEKRGVIAAGHRGLKLVKPWVDLWRNLDEVPGLDLGPVARDRVGPLRQELMPILNGGTRGLAGEREDLAEALPLSVG